MKLFVVANPTVEPVSLSEAHLHLRLDTEGSPPSHPDDLLLEAFISAAREYAENYTGQALAEKTFEYRVAVSASILIPMAPVLEVVSVKYLDSDDVVQTVDPSVYELDPSDPNASVLKLQTDQTWPSGASELRIQFLAGYIPAGSSPAYASVPFSIKAGILLMLGHLYENREAVIAVNAVPYEIPLGVEALLRPYRIRLGMA